MPTQVPPAAIGAKQEIKARSGTAAFVPGGHTIKIINSYGAQGVAVWAFALHDAPTEQEMADQEEDVKQAEQDLEAAVSRRHETPSPSDRGDEPQPAPAQDEDPHGVRTTAEDAEPDDAGRADDTNVKKSWTKYLPSVRGRPKQPATTDDPQTLEASAKTAPAPRKTWASYLPSVPNKTGHDEPRSWASHIPSGHGFSSYIPKDALHAISEIHKRDPNKSVAEQLYDFSKTPAGAAGLSSKDTSRGMSS
jgi:hypothetical protein